MTAPLTLEFFTSAPDVDSLPRSKREVAVVGRSNVGKSSLLNALARQKGLAKVSRTPGRTQLLNCFKMGEATVIDLPGYGWTSTGAKDRKAWQARLERYLTEREGLEMVLLLIDGEVGPTKLDVEMLGYLRGHTIPLQVVATKHDKVKSSKRDKRKKDLAAGCSLTPKDIIWVSADKNVGIDRLRLFVRDVLTGVSG
jgi:GTP-binding protein